MPFRVSSAHSRRRPLTPPSAPRATLIASGTAPVRPAPPSLTPPRSSPIPPHHPPGRRLHRLRSLGRTRRAPPATDPRHAYRRPCAPALRRGANQGPTSRAVSPAAPVRRTSTPRPPERARCPGGSPVSEPAPRPRGTPRTPIASTVRAGRRSGSAPRRWLATDHFVSIRRPAARAPRDAHPRFGLDGSARTRTSAHSKNPLGFAWPARRRGAARAAGQPARGAGRACELHSARLPACPRCPCSSSQLAREPRHKIRPHPRTTPDHAESLAGTR